MRNDAVEAAIVAGSASPHQALVMKTRLTGSLRNEVQNSEHNDTAKLSENDRDTMCNENSTSSVSYVSLWVYTRTRMVASSCATVVGDSRKRPRRKYYQRDGNHYNYQSSSR